MLGTIGMTLLGMVLMQATEAPDINGQWTSDEWGTVVLEAKGSGKYEGTFSGAATGQPARGSSGSAGSGPAVMSGGGPGKGKSGTLQLKWSRVERRFNGTWRTGEDRNGKMSLRRVDIEIRGAWTTDKDVQLESGTPRLADLLWRRQKDETQSLGPSQKDKRVRNRFIAVVERLPADPSRPNDRSEPGQLQMRVFIAVSITDLVRVGDLARITIDAIPKETFFGKVVAIDVVDPRKEEGIRSSRYEAIVSFDEVPKHLVAGLTAEVEIEPTESGTDGSQTESSTGDNLAPEKVPGVEAAFDAFRGRTHDKERLLKFYGGTAESEAAVRKGLTWIADQQRSDGAWLFWKSPIDESVAATAMALLAFQGAGNTHQSGDFKNNVRRGIEWLLKQQKENGEFPGATLYTHGLCLNVIAELYGMSRDPDLHDAAKRAVAFAVESQNDSRGGWRYRPQEEGDTSVTGWFVQGLTTARHASLDVPDQSFRLMRNYLDAAQRDEGESYPYVARGGTSQPGTTAIGLLCRQLLDQDRDTKGMATGLTRLGAVYGFDIKENDYYYWYHTSQALRNYGGPAWDSWNDNMRSLLCAKQVPHGPSSGRWPPESRWGDGRGSIYTTCMAVLTLEVYYRHPSPFDLIEKATAK